ncbi:hypothetical protein MM26B8_04750 [Mycoplasmopsis meleagridis]|uniref:Uncharacterized protein n=1 Tax=Mycoplasmopsis meleagridis ATCC 25294 TaxID=1264554 RepID=A0A0F5H1H6_9BACT|nr:YhjD/YihY/BrkB family envelope integrity protein [Mycoplasmopsis meleagridis]KKB26717.1 hypothetical protein MMELEA_00990 [Mycoplasmopsis meleagridis ATCC 25294]KUH47585.1 hypothetical protein ASB56_00400 [Mycoplasmopsis meleagridis]OAD18167.1 hypothetical protein MM26B8_04750 [Mycoplasmopsis meleagridis]VEU77250.1 Ribonuclease BN-like family [Mycoplasmopsis meleagridis]
MFLENSKKIKGYITSSTRQRKIKKLYRKKINNSILKNKLIGIKKERPWIETIIDKFIGLILNIFIWKRHKSYVLTLRHSDKDKKQLIQEIKDKFFKKEYRMLPVALAFYFLVSFVPIIVVLLALLSLIPNYNNLFVEVILIRIIPGIKSAFNGSEIAEIIAPKSTLSVVAIVLSALISIWLSSSGFGKFIYLQNLIYEHDNPGNFALNRLKGCFITLGICLYLFVWIIIYLTFFNAFDKAIQTDAFFYPSFLIFLLIALFLGIILLYIFAPSFKNWELKHNYPGALISSVLITFFIMIFGLLTKLINYSRYGIIAVFMYIALFVTFISFFLYLGLIVNNAFFKNNKQWTLPKKYWFKQF